AEVFTWALDALEEARAGGLLHRQGESLAARNINSHRDGDGKVCLPLERENLLRLVVFEDFKVFFLEVVDVAIRLVRDVEGDRDQLRADLDGRVVLRRVVFGRLLVFLLLLASLRLRVLREA